MNLAEISMTGAAGVNSIIFDHRIIEMLKKNYKPFSKNFQKLTKRAV